METGSGYFPSFSALTHQILQWKVKGFVVRNRSVPSRETLNFRLLFLKSATVSVLVLKFAIMFDTKTQCVTGYR